MRRERQERTVLEVREVRALQQLSAEARASKTASLLSERQTVLDLSIEEQHSLEAGWQSAVSAGTLPVEMARLWSAALLQQDQQVRTAKGDVSSAKAALDRDVGELNAATRRHDDARSRVRKAASATALHRDEVRLVEVLDRLGRRGADA